MKRLRRLSSSTGVAGACFCLVVFGHAELSSSAAHRHYFPSAFFYLSVPQVEVAVEKLEPLKASY